MIERGLRSIVQGMRDRHWFVGADLSADLTYTVYLCAENYQGEEPSLMGVRRRRGPYRVVVLTELDFSRGAARLKFTLNPILCSGVWAEFDCNEDEFLELVAPRSPLWLIIRPRNIRETSRYIAFAPFGQYQYVTKERTPSFVCCGWFELRF